MKNNTLGIGLVIGLTSLAFGLVGCPKKETQGKHGIVLRAQDHQNVEDKWEAIRKVLYARSETPGADHRTKLFHIRKYQPGRDPVDEGELDDSFLLEEIPAVDKDDAKGFRGHAVQIGFGYGQDFQAIPKGEGASGPAVTGGIGSPQRQMPQAHFRENIVESQKMVDEVNGILANKPDTTGSPR